MFEFEWPVSLLRLLEARRRGGGGGAMLVRPKVETEDEREEESKGREGRRDDKAFGDVAGSKWLTWTEGACVVDV